MLSVGAWPIIVCLLLYIAYCVYGNANPGTTYAPFSEFMNQAASGDTTDDTMTTVSDVLGEIAEKVADTLVEAQVQAEEVLSDVAADDILQELSEL